MSSSKLVATAACMDWLTDPTVFAVNREPAHSDHRFYDHAPLPGETMGPVSYTHLTLPTTPYV